MFPNHALGSPCSASLHSRRKIFETGRGEQGNQSRATLGESGVMPLPPPAFQKIFETEMQFPAF